MPLTLKELEWVESEAASLIKKNKITSPPINVEQLAKHLGLNVIAYDFGEEISGTLVIENGKGYIGYNPSHPKVRQRFTIAHEIGHFQLHNSTKNEQIFVDKDFIVKYRNANNYTIAELKHEQEANAFAAALLMPKEFINRELSKKSNANIHEYGLIESFSKLFNVSVHAMTYRLTNINMFFT